MRPLPRWWLVLLTCAACSSVPPRPPELGPHGDARTITAADLAEATQLSLLDYLTAQRPRWLRGVDGRAITVEVYINDAASGGAAALRDIPLAEVASARYFDLAAAQARYGGRLRVPVIAITMKER